MTEGPARPFDGPARLIRHVCVLSWRRACPGAQEAAQEVFLRLYTTLRKGDKLENPRAWVFRVAHNLGLKIRTRQNSEEPLDPDWGEQNAGPSGNPESELLERERMTRFHSAVEGLSEQQR